VWPQYGPLGDRSKDGWYYGIPWPNDDTASPRDVYLKLDTIDYAALLADHLPIWAFDSGENFFPQKASAFTDNWFHSPAGWVNSTAVANTLFDGDGNALAAAGSPGPSSGGPNALSLNALGTVYSFGSGSGPESSTGDYIDARGGSETTYSMDSAYQFDHGNGDAVYERVGLRS
jgi:hypothetical protein